MVTLDDHVAIVTAASSGSGVFARAPAEAGVDVDVVLAARREDWLADTRAAVEPRIASREESSGDPVRHDQALAAVRGLVPDEIAWRNQFGRLSIHVQGVNRACV